MSRRRGYRVAKNYDPSRGRPGGARRGKRDASAHPDAERRAHQGKSEGTNQGTRADRDANRSGSEVRADRLPPAERREAPKRLAATRTRAEDVAGVRFAELGLGGNIVRSLAEQGANEAYPIQAVTIPEIIAGHDVLGRAHTGSGKTIAFGAALVERLLKLKAEGAFASDPAKAERQRGVREGKSASSAEARVRRARTEAGRGRNRDTEAPSDARGRGGAPGAGRGRQQRPQARAPKALILAPTRELALQIDRTVQPIARSVGFYTAQLVGGMPFEPQLHALGRGIDIVIGTPGRILDLVQRGHLDLSEIHVSVIDEADHMCELGFLESVQQVLRRTATGGQRLLFSATLDREVDAIIDEFLEAPAVHEIVGASGEGASLDSLGNVEHRVLIVLREDKNEVLRELVATGRRVIVFCRTRAYAEQITDLLAATGVNAVALHGDLSQTRRARNLERFTEGKSAVLVATDVAARGIHVDGVDLVVQADPPDDAKGYVHRAGRTGRTGDGRVLTVIARTRQKRTRELFAELGVEPASFADFVPGQQLPRLRKGRKR